jgi:hypothetical protein
VERTGTEARGVNNMRLILFAVFGLFLLVIVGVTSWAFSRMPFWETPREVFLHPWFQATFVDAYLGFLTFYAWVYYKEVKPLHRLLWLVAILCLGNMAMASYVLLQLWKLPKGAGPEELLSRRQ